MSNEATSKITACIITNRSDSVFFKALASVSAADEILIIDNDSGVNWQLVSKKYPALQVRSYSRRITNFALVRNYGLKQARHDWVLFLDSDEVLDPGGVKKLRKIASTRAAGAKNYDLVKVGEWRSLVLFLLKKLLHWVKCTKF
jgi:glycosyltransferase involved in cell wall biosynthesis